MTLKRRKMCATCVHRHKDMIDVGEHFCHEDTRDIVCAGSSKAKGNFDGEPDESGRFSSLLKGGKFYDYSSDKFITRFDEFIFGFLKAWEKRQQDEHQNPSKV